MSSGQAESVLGGAAEIGREEIARLKSPLPGGEGSSNSSWLPAVAADESCIVDFGPARPLMLLATTCAYTIHVNGKTVMGTQGDS